MMSTPKPTPWYLWPFVALRRFVGWILGFTGRILAVVLGLALMIVGVLVSLTVVGAIIGVPLAIVGFLLVVRGLFYAKSRLASQYGFVAYAVARRTIVAVR